ncbi:unnamed protein product, partial [Iphiclides podalirius]
MQLQSGRRCRVDSAATHRNAANNHFASPFIAARGELQYAEIDDSTRFRRYHAASGRTYVAVSPALALMKINLVNDVGAQRCRTASWNVAARRCRPARSF